ncbi:MAG: GNAT family N-acetyltransferase [Burkholderiaceae bacterium]|nr:GNAT family N-acetyltransferase [Burkholderiaceae bacterium]
MIPTKDWLKASWNAGIDLLRPVSNRETGDAHPPSYPLAHPTLVVPIRSLGPTYRERIATHLLALEPADRYLRFGYYAGDEHIHRYVDQLNFEQDEIFGVYNRRLELIAMAHLALAQSPGHEQCAEFGVSVLPKGRGQGLGTRLFERATIHARNAGVRMVFIHALTQNRAMLNIVRHAGAVITQDGSESEAYLTLPPATLDSRMTELVEQQWAELDYRLKQQAQLFWRFLAGVQAVRQGVQAERHQSAE